MDWKHAVIPYMYTDTESVHATMMPATPSGIDQSINQSINQMYFYSASLLSTAKFKGAYKSVNPNLMWWVFGVTAAMIITTG